MTLNFSLSVIFASSSFGPFGISISLSFFNLASVRTCIEYMDPVDPCITLFLIKLAIGEYMSMLLKHHLGVFDYVF